MKKGFTLIETMIAITLLSVSIVAPMMLTVQSLSSAYYSRDQITASYLAQEAIEQVHQIRDNQILEIAKASNASSINIFGDIPLNKDFTVDARESSASQVVKDCPTTGCPVLKASETSSLYGYGTSNDWKDTYFTRKVRACYVQTDGTCTGNQTDEMRITVTVSWITKNGQTAKPFVISENLYRWVQDGADTT